MHQDLLSVEAGAVAYQQQHQQVLENPFLRDFVLEGRGAILYPVSPPYWSQEAEALVLLARTLPATLSRIDFWPLPRAHCGPSEEGQVRQFGREDAPAKPAEWEALGERMSPPLGAGTPSAYLPFIPPDRGPILILGRPELLPPYVQECKFEAVVPGPEDRKAESPSPPGPRYVIQVQPCVYPLEGPMWVAGQPAALVGGPEMGDLLRQIEHLAQDDEPVLLTGPSGTGKELVARLIYGYRCRRLLAQGQLKEESLDEQAPFVPVNCGAIPANLVETELFGQVKGAFTDAAGRPGLLRAAGEGVVCLDEIGELDYALQSKLLRVLQERKVRPVGADREEPYRAKIVALTNRDLLADIQAQRFRADLHARFPHRLALPPLRERRMDVPALLLAYLGRRNPALRAVGMGGHALRVLLTEEYAESNVRTLQDGFLYSLKTMLVQVFQQVIFDLRQTVEIRKYGWCHTFPPFLCLRNR